MSVLSPTRRSLGFAILAAIGVLLLFASSVSASVAQEEQAGSQVLRELEAGKRRCADLKGSDFDHVGEYFMGRMAGSPHAHEAMNNMMTAMMGAGEQQMHEAMGRRVTACGGGRPPGGFGRWMGAMMGGPGARGWAGPGAMMGGRGRRGMMGGWFDEGNNGSEGPSTAALIGMIAGLIVILALALGLGWLALGRRRGPASDSPAKILKRRYANGEISTEEYRTRLDALS